MRLDPGITGSGGISGSEDLAGAEDIAGAVEKRSGYNSFSGGLTCKRLLYYYYNIRESYVEGTTFSGGLPPYVTIHLVGELTV